MVKKVKKYYDIVIVGSGPAGCSFLDNLDEKYDVLMVDKNKIPYSKVCGGLLTNDSMEFFNEINIDTPDYIFSHPKKLKKEYVDLDNNVSRIDGYVYNTERTELNKWLFDRVKDKADVLEETSFEKMENCDDKINVMLKDKNNNITEVSCKYLIGADGVYSKVRKEIKVPCLTKYVAIQDIGETDKELDKFILFFSKDTTDYYAWAIPKGDKIITGLAYPHEFTNKVDKIRKITEKKIGGKIKVYKREGYSIARPLSQDELFLGEGNVLLIGEAAGWISPSSGDGISFALRSGYNCAKSFKDGENILENYKKNSKKLFNNFIKKLKKSKIISSPKLRAKLFE